MRTKRFYLILLGLMSLGFFIRIAVCYDLWHKDSQVVNPSVYTDMATYKSLAAKVSSGEFEGEFDYQPFYYVIFLPLVSFFSAGNIWGVLAAQSFVGGLVIFLSALTAGVLFGKRSAIICAILLVFTQMALLYTPYHLIATLQSFWVAAICLTSVLAVRKKSFKYWLVTSALCSMGILTRGNLWFFVPGILIGSIYSFWRAGVLSQDAPKLRIMFKLSLKLILILAVIILPQIPFAWHNSTLKGKLCGPSTAGPKVLALGNTPEAPPGGRNPGFGPGPMEYPPTFNAWTNKANTDSTSREIFLWALREPLVFIELNFRKALLFWDYREIPNNIALEFQGSKSCVFKYLALIPTSLLICACLAGLILLSLKIKGKPSTWPIIYYLVTYWLAVSAFYNLARFRVPIIPILAIFAAYCLDSTVRLIARKKYRMVWRKNLPALLVGFFICFIAFDFYRSNLEAAVMRQIRPNGVRVKIPGKGLMTLDNGPVTFGAWFSLPLSPGLIIEKEYAGPVVSGGAAEFQLSLMSNYPGELELLLNQDRKVVKIDRKGLNIYTFKSPYPKENIFQIKILSVPAGCFGVVDGQRNYGRTKINGKKVPGELVARVYQSVAGDDR